MNTARFTTAAYEPVFHAPPAPFARKSEDFPSVVTTRQTRRHHKQRMPLLEVVITGVVLVATAFGAKLIMDLPPRSFGPIQRQPRQYTPQADRVTVPQGQGASGPGGRRPSGTNLDGMARAGAGCQPVLVADVHSVVEQAIVACREGRFDDADELGQKAMRAAPENPRGEAIRLLQAYVRQYSDLADEAIDRMNGAVEVDLGRRHGMGAFVERAGDDVVFMARGRHVRFTLRGFNSLDGVRFRVTRQFLENGCQAANDLILGAVHYVKQLDETGSYRANGAGVREAAKGRWETAARSSDHVVANHAQALLALLEHAGNQIAGTR